MQIRLDEDWAPRPYQVPAWRYLSGDGKRAVLVWHRRSGKDELAMRYIMAASQIEPGNYLHMLPKNVQARKAIWDAVDAHTGMRRIDMCYPKILRRNWRDSDMFIGFTNGSTVQVVGSDNFEHLVGSGYRGIVFSEYAQADPKAWTLLRPMLVENDGWAMFVSTPRGKNHLWRLLQMAEKDPRWFTQVLPAEETGVFAAEQLAVELKELTTEYGQEEGQGFFEQEYRCDFNAPILGAYYGSQLRVLEAEGRISRIDIDRGARVFTAWDLGMDDATAIWLIQCVGRERRLIGYYQNSGHGLEHYVSWLQEHRAKHKYVFGAHYLPHDVNVRELNTGQSRKDTLFDLGLVDIEVMANYNVMDGINVVRRMLGRTWIDNRDETGCAQGLEVLRNYCREWDENNKTWKNTPLHNWASHGADALRVFGCMFDDPAAMKKIRDRSRPGGDDSRGDTGTSHWAA